MGAGVGRGGSGSLPGWISKSIARRAALSAAVGSTAVAATLIVTAVLLDPSGGVRPVHLAVGLLSVAMSAGMAYSVSSRHVVPLREVADAARRGGPPERLEAIHVFGDDELADAIRALNDLLDRLRQAARAQAEEESRLRRRAEGRLDLVHSALEQSTEAMGIVAADGLVLFANDAAARVLGQPRGGDLVGRSAHVDWMS